MDKVFLYVTVNVLDIQISLSVSKLMENFRYGNLLYLSCGFNAACNEVSTGSVPSFSVSALARITLRCGA